PLVPHPSRERPPPGGGHRARRAAEVGGLAVAVRLPRLLQALPHPALPAGQAALRLPPLQQAHLPVLAGVRPPPQPVPAPGPAPLLQGRRRGGLHPRGGQGRGAGPVPPPPPRPPPRPPAERPKAPTPP